TTFSGQFSPRTLQTFISDRMTQNVLAIFISGFTYDIIVFFQLKSPDAKVLFISPIIAVIIAIIAAIFFVLYINHIAKMVQRSEERRVGKECRYSCHRSSYDTE